MNTLKYKHVPPNYDTIPYTLIIFKTSQCSWLRLCQLIYHVCYMIYSSAKIMEKETRIFEWKVIWQFWESDNVKLHDHYISHEPDFRRSIWLSTGMGVIFQWKSVFLFLAVNYKIDVIYHRNFDYHGWVHGQHNSRAGMEDVVICTILILFGTGSVSVAIRIQIKVHCMNMSDTNQRGTVPHKLLNLKNGARYYVTHTMHFLKRKGAAWSRTAILIDQIWVSFQVEPM